MRAARAAAGFVMAATLLAGLPQGAGAQSRGVSSGHVILDAADAASREYELRVRYRLQPASAKVFAVCFERLPGNVDAGLGLGLAASGDVKFVEILRSTGDDRCDSAIVDAVWDAGPFPRVPLELLARLQPGETLAIPINLVGKRGAVPLGPIPARTTSEVQPPSNQPAAVLPVAIVLMIATASAAVLVALYWRSPRRPRPRGETAEVPPADPRPRAAAAAAPPAAAGADARFRLTIDFTDRQAMLDFVDVLKRDELLPPAARAHRIDPAAPALSPATEAYVVVRPDSDERSRPSAG